MKNLLTAIISRYQGDATLLGAGGPFLRYAPERQAFPYCLMHVVGSMDLNLTYGSTYLEPIRIQFDFVDVDDDNPLTLHDALHTRFHRQALTLGSGSMIACTRVMSPINLPAVTLASTGQTVFQWSADYRFILQK